MVSGGDGSLAAPVRLRVDSRSVGTIDRQLITATHPLPRLSWTVPLLRNGQRQKAFEVRTSWDGTLRGSDDPWVTTRTPLAPHSRAEWSVRVRDENDQWSDWAGPCTFETGPFSLADWSSHWVSLPALSTAHRTFDIRGGVRSARLHLTAQGLVRAELNGVPVNADSSDPSRTDLVRAVYRTYDVTDLVDEGANDLALTVARGEWERTGLDPRVLAELVIQLSDGTTVATGTGPGMTAQASPVVVAEPFYLERHDATRPTVAEGLTAPVVLAAVERPHGPHEPPAEVLPDPSPPIRVVSVWRPSPVAGSHRVFELGTNIAGRSQVALHSGIPRGTVVTVVHGEHLDQHGRVDTTNLSLPSDRGRRRQVVEYVATGSPGQVLEPWFCYHGFAYLEVSGLPDDAVIDVVARSLHSDLTSASTLTTDEPLVTTLIAAARRTLLNNVHGIPEDCPTREQSGWTGDAASATDFEFASFDMQTFFDKWLGDLRTSQQPDGSIPAIAPDIRREPVPADPVWGAAVPRVLLAHWLSYGDARVVEENIVMLRRWVDFQLSCVDDEGLIGRSPISYGHDWLALAQTPPRLLHTAAAMESLEALLLLEAAVGNDALPERIAQLESLRAAGIARFVDPDDLSVGNGSQASLAVALRTGWVGADRAGRDIEADVRRRGNRLSSGFAATRTIVDALAEVGRSQILMDAICQPAEPGIGAMLTSGPGTLWENWWVDPANTGTGSLDHVGLGGPLAGWAERRLAGLTPTAAGYARFEFRPCFVREVTELDYERTTVRGRIAASYRREGTSVRLRLTVPVGTECDVVLPGQPTTTVESGHHEFECRWAPEPRVDPTDLGPWHPPALLVCSPDVRGGHSWLADGIAHDRVHGSGLELHPTGLTCMPVPHAQLPGPVLTVTGDPFIRLDLDEPVELSRGSFVYAEIDTCDSGPADPRVMRLELVGEDGSRRRATGQVWPAGWNRIALDLAGWATTMTVVAVEVSVEFAPGPAPRSFHLGSIGVSERRRTW